MKRVYHRLPDSVSIHESVVWCRGQGIPVVIRYPVPTFDWPSAGHAPYTQRIVTGRKILSVFFNGKPRPLSKVQPPRMLVVRDQDYDLVRLRF